MTIITIYIKQLKVHLAFPVDGMLKGVLVLSFYLYFSMAKHFLIEVGDETLNDESLRDGDDQTGNDYGKNSFATTVI